jgi:hypothetical protein
MSGLWGNLGSREGRGVAESSLHLFPDENNLFVERTFGMHSLSAVADVVLLHILKDLFIWCKYHCLASADA